MISEAIFDGHRLAREFDGPDPSIPPPFDRERELPTSV
jgi:dimethylamine/trimethylamine dehydrogenase